MIWPPLPLSGADLDRYQIRARQQRRPTLTGGHQMRRKGQSLEFRDYRDYIPGDDVRHIDWRASLRRGPGGHRLVREFVAEESLTLVISLDFRESMWLPQPQSKLTLALWLAEALALITLAADDAVVLHPLFGAGPTITLRGRGSRSRVRGSLSRLVGEGPCSPQNNLAPLARCLPPTSVWLVISDFYFQEENLARSLAAAMQKAQEGFRWLLSLDLDSWPFERVLLGEGARRIEGPGVSGRDRPMVELDQQNLHRLEREIDRHKNHFRQSCGRTGHDLIHWPWPAEPNFEPGPFFRSHFQQDPMLQRLFMAGSL